ncbi:Cro/Cl family transcriptional regulator [Streptococcus sp. zg-86]|uniref:Cro/Cl family transcriptional regulator n=1 Tax=Streptococcus zhangguiae TaxID=2664091 RepID=A0ABW9R2Q1_9STRE|nr:MULTISPECIES: XRE family transcriptional regulator [unclassified Streptococcus]MTB64235.1 Cro/Cl family transcriptional regulator [Streptococcus sp. zg-86]MTB90439.1 Cro/Cl family transcriptional regulator [Streptococcus sp. zg-36]QTH48156.1 Cro/Cl family transcriptional regulator [Streptococcus sp. zg-86]
MSQKKTFGQIISDLRQEKGLSREMVCGDERELSVRQLIRLEKGESKPTLTKIEYLADGLGVPLYQLMEDYTELPKRYIDLKYLLMRTGLFGPPTLIKQKEQYLSEIYENYYDELPEDEQVAVDVLQSWIDVFATGKTVFGNQMLEEYFHQVKQKTVYQINDLLILELYFYCLYLDNRLFDPNVYQHFLTCLMDQDAYLPIEQVFFLITVAVTCIAVGLNNGYCKGIGQLLKKVKKLMKQTQDYQHLPIIRLQECQILWLKKRKWAERWYKKIQLSLSEIGHEEVLQKFEEWREQFVNKGLRQS